MVRARGLQQTARACIAPVMEALLPANVRAVRAYPLPDGTDDDVAESSRVMDGWLYRVHLIPRHPTKTGRAPEWPR